jgi:TetR/AcrR family transcriptional regulator
VEPHSAVAPLSSREKILDVAEALFARRGFAGVGMRELADAVGLGKSSLFHHFASKALLYCEVLGRVLARIREALAPALAAPGPAPVRLARWVEALVDTLAEHPTSARLLLRALFEDDDLPEGSPEFEAAERTLWSILADVQELLRQGVASGHFREVSTPHTVQTLVGATVFHFASGELGDQLLGRSLFSAEEVACRKAELVELLRRGLARGGDAGS